MNEEYETRFLCNSSKVRGQERGLRQRRPPAYTATLGLGEREEVGGEGAAGARTRETRAPGFFALQEGGLAL